MINLQRIGFIIQPLEKISTQHKVASFNKSNKIFCKECVVGELTFDEPADRDSVGKWHCTSSQAIPYIIGQYEIERN